MSGKALRAVVVLVGSLSGLLLGEESAVAFDLGGGVSMGGVVIGTRPRFAVSPHAAVAWRTEGGILLALQDMVSVLPATSAHGAGVYNHTSMILGYAWGSGRFGLGPSLAIHSLPACGPAWCARLSGASPGARAQVDYYFAGPLGVSVSATVDWLTGSTVVPAGVAATVLAGPSLKWSIE